MTKIPGLKKDVVKEIKAYINELVISGIKPKKIFLFGSYAKGNFHKYSDIDLAVISPAFKADEIEELMFLGKLSGRISSRVEAVSFREKEFEFSKYHTLIGEIKKYGKVVYENTSGI